MKKTVGKIYLALIALACASCSQDETAGGDALPEGKCPLALTANVDGMATRAVGKDAWTNGDVIGVSLGGTLADQTAYTAEGEYSLTADGAATAVSGKEIYWQSNNAGTVTAWYPCSAETNTDISDQSSDDKYKAFDWLKAEAQDVAFNSVAALAFKHQMAKIACTLTKGSNITDEQLETATVKVYGYTSADYGKGEVSANAASGQGWISTTPDLEALVIPTTLSSGTAFIKVSIGGNEFTYSLPGETTFSAGTVYTYNITVNADGIEVSCNESGAWEEGGSMDVSGVDLSCIDISQYEILSISSITDDTYTAADGKKVLIVGDGTTYDKKITVGDGATLAICNLSLATSDANLIKCAGDATIMLLGENKVSVTSSSASNSAMSVAEGKTMTIDGTGKLTATGGNKVAGIGSGFYGTCGNITINGGTITATSSDSGAGIGAGFYGTCGNITINGGTITATSSDSGAGIGAGYEESTCGDITITGGTVIATGGSSGAGIGSGFSNYDDDENFPENSFSAGCGNISITGGTVTATGGTTYGGAGIGAGYWGQCKNIFIGKGVTQVTATKGNGKAASIGLGFCGRYNPDGSYGVTIEEGANVTQN